uniref:C2H2-type domain-containing protein n=1 Tax=Ascaris lumbricoides TaxID=6252 RepID=A0A9J2P0H1_ASCLU
MFSCERGVEMAQKEKSGVLYGSLLEHFPSKHHITHSGECIDFSTISPCDDSRDISATATLRFRTLSYSLSTARISSVHDLVLAGAFTERCWTTKKGNGKDLFSFADDVIGGFIVMSVALSLESSLTTIEATFSNGPVQAFPELLKVTAIHLAADSDSGVGRWHRLKMTARESALTGGNLMVLGETTSNREHRRDPSITSLEDDDFELISSVHEVDIPSVTHREAPGIPLSDLRILPMIPPSGMATSNVQQSTVTSVYASPSEANNSVHSGGDGEKTPVMDRSVELQPGRLAPASSTTLLDQSVLCNGHSERSASVHSFSAADCSVIDPVSAIESIRADYHAAQDMMREEIDLLKKTCLAKHDEVMALRRRLDEATDEKTRMVEELSRNEQALKELSLKYDELTAEKMQCDDVIKVQANTIQQLRCDGSGSSLPPSVVHEQGLMTSLQAKDRQIDELTVELVNVKKQYENERAKAVDLEEIVKVTLRVIAVKILHEQNGESDQLLRQAQHEYRVRINELEAKVRRYVERGEVNNVDSPLFSLIYSATNIVVFLMASAHRSTNVLHFAHRPTIGCSHSDQRRHMAVVYNVHVVDERQGSSCNEDEDRGHGDRAELTHFVGEPPTCFIEETGAVWQGAEEVVVSDLDFSMGEGTAAEVKQLSVGQQPSYETLGASSYEFFETIDDLPQSAVDDEVKYVGVDRSLDEEVDANHQQIAYDLFVTSEQKYPSALRSVSDSTNDDYLRAVSSLYRSNRKFLKLQRQAKRDVSEETFAGCRPSSDDAVPQCTKNEYRTEVEALLYSCFGDTRLVRCRSPSIVECVRDLIDGVCAQSRSSSSQRKDIERSCESGDGERCPMAADFVDKLTVSRKRRSVGYSALYASSCALCHLSGILHRERHVLQHHLNEDVFKCPCCNFSSCYAKNSVKDHIRTQHSHIASTEPMDLRPQFRDRIDYLYMKCFLNGCDQHDIHAYP